MKCRFCLLDVSEGEWEERSCVRFWDVDELIRWVESHFGLDSRRARDFWEGHDLDRARSSGQFRYPVPDHDLHSALVCQVKKSLSNYAVKDDGFHALILCKLPC